MLNIFEKSGIFFTVMLALMLMSIGEAKPSVNKAAKTASQTHAAGGSFSTSKQDKTLSWVGCGITRKAFMKELANAYFKKSGIKIILAGGGATRGIRDTATNQADMGGSCRHILPISDEEKVSLIQVGWDALVAVVNPENPVSNISLDDLQKVLTGTITNWQQLGGNNQPIKLVIRSGKISGVGMMMRELIFFDRNKNFALNAHVVVSSGPLEKFIEKEPAALGVTGVSSAKRRKLKILKLNNSTASYQNIATGNYPLFRPLYLVVPKTAANIPKVKNFIEFAISDEGQKVLKENGTVTLEDGNKLCPKFRQKMLKSGVRMGDY